MSECNALGTEHRLLMVSLIIPNLSGKELLRQCLKSLLSMGYPNYEIIVVDAGPTGGAPDMVEEEFPNVKLLRERESV